MAREVVTHIWCDPCSKEDERNEGKERLLLLDEKMKPHRIALCEVHDKELYQPLLEVVLELGVIEKDGVVTPAPSSSAAPARRNRTQPPAAIPVEPSISDDDVFPVGNMCKMPGCDTVSKSQDGLKQHLYQHHQKISLEIYRNFLRNPSGVDVSAYAPEPEQLDFVCRIAECAELPDGGYIFRGADYQKPRGAFSGHLRKRHDMSMAEAEKIASNKL